MALINRPIYEHFGARHLGVKGPGALTQLEESVMGTLPMDLSSPAPYWYLQGFRTFGAHKGQGAGGAGTYTKIGISLEDTDDLILVQILRVYTSAAASRIATFRCLRTDFTSDPGVYGYGTDTRIPEAQHSNAIIISENDAASPGQELCLSSDDFSDLYKWGDGCPLIVSPGQAIYFKTQDADESMSACIEWVEIPAYKAEL